MTIQETPPVSSRLLKRMIVEMDGLDVPFIDAESLVVNKKACGRPQDLADVAALEAG